MGDGADGIVGVEGIIKARFSGQGSVDLNFERGLFKGGVGRRKFGVAAKGRKPPAASLRWNAIRRSRSRGTINSVLSTRRMPFWVAKRSAPEPTK